MGRRERVTITAHAATDGAPDVTISGSLTSFQVNTRMSYDLGGKRLRQSDDKVEVIVYMLLDPEDARVFRDRNKRREPEVRRLVTSTERSYRATERTLMLLAMPPADVDAGTFRMLTGALPPWLQLPASTTIPDPARCAHNDTAHQGQGFNATGDAVIVLRCRTCGERIEVSFS